MKKKTGQYNSSKIKGVCEICKESEGTEVHHLIYQKEFENGNSKGNKLKKNHKANLINICEKCHDKIHEEKSQLKIYKTTNGYEIL